MLTDGAMDALSKCRGLESFSIANSKFVTSAGVRMMIRSCPRLKILYLDNMSRIEHIAFQFISTHPIESLTVRRCPSLSDETFKSFSDSIGIKQNLSYFDASYTPGISDYSLLAIVNKCLKLSVVKLTGCKALTDASIERMFKLPKLVHLEIQDCPVHDRSLSGDTKSGLRHLDMSGCTELTDRGLKGLATMAHNLRHIDLTGCVNITDIGLRDMLFGCRNLVYINVQGSVLLTSASIGYIQAACQHLANLNMFGITNVSAKTIWTLVLHCPTLRTLILSPSPEVRA